ncbi:NmrA/HSCARG family protein [Rhizophagus clarus]|uniref:NmrA/HSCARG family protein n=1 Tax=Rhizophagus clarus TaxID=94130 RepID=A0A8H3LZZ3_9GLOM|nr:NmrA/HSCARG family protein [Rhizophagus clarus]
MIADIAKEEGVNWLIYSSIVDSTVESGGKYPDVIQFTEENDQLPMIDVESDTGPIVAKIIEEGPAKWNGKRVPVAAEYVTMKHIVDILTKVTGKKHKLKTMSDDDIVKLDSYINNEQMKQMFKFIKEYGVFGRSDELQDISIVKKLYPNIKTFEQYAFETFGKAK